MVAYAWAGEPGELQIVSVSPGPPGTGLYASHSRWIMVLELARFFKKSKYERFLMVERPLQHGQSPGMDWG